MPFRIHYLSESEWNETENNVGEKSLTWLIFPNKRQLSRVTKQEGSKTHKKCGLPQNDIHGTDSKRGYNNEYRK